MKIINMVILTNLLALTSLIGQQKKSDLEAKSSIHDNSKKSILARGCDPIMSASAAKAIPPLIGNPEYVPTTNDIEFFEKLKSRKWSIIFFAPGACRISAAQMPIPGNNINTKDWTLEQYREMVYKLQGPNVQIVETLNERETVGLLKEALKKARNTNENRI